MKDVTSFEGQYGQYLLHSLRGWKFQLLYKVIGHYEEGLYSLVKCSNCGMIQIFPRPQQSFLNFFYNKYFDFNPCFSTTNPYGSSSYEIILGVIKAHFTKPGVLLHIGCGNGEFLEMARKKCGWDVFGIDMSSSTCEVCENKGIKTYCGELMMLNSQTIPLILW